MDGRLGVPCDMHHILSGGRRISHSHTVGLCPWHHRAVNATNESDKEVELEYGPSLARSPKRFAERYGTPKELIEIQNELIAKLHEVTNQ